MILIKNLILKKRYEEPLKRNNNYRNKTSILDKIYLHDVISLSDNNKYLSYNSNEDIILDNITNDNYIFIEIKLTDNFCKLWNYNSEKFVVYNTKLKKFKLSETVTKYNDIDLLNDIDMLDSIELSVFEDYSFDNKKEYRLAYYISSQPSNFIYLNTDGTPDARAFKINTLYKYSGKLKNITNIDKNTGSYEEYCKICASSNSISNNLLDKKTYLVEETAGNLNLSLGKYEIDISGPIDVVGYTYFAVSTLEIDDSSYSKNILLKTIKKKII